MPPRKFDPRPGGANGEDGEPVKIEGIIRTKNGMGIGSFSRGAARRHMAIEEYAVDWNGPATEPPPRLRLLLLTDVDLASAKRVVEWALQGSKAFDLCAVCGDFVPRPEEWSTAGETEEEELSAEEGEMSATLAQLENTVCRVVYVPGPLDPVMPSTRLSRAPSNNGTAAAVAAAAAAAAAAAGAGPGGLLQLTPTSKNLYRRNLRLAPCLSMAGFTEEPNPRIDSSSSSKKRDVEVGGIGGEGKFAGDQTYSTLRSLCRSGSRNRGGRGPANGSSSGAASLMARKAAPPESVILMTRLGGAQRGGRWRRRPSASGSCADAGSSGNSGSVATIAASKGTRTRDGFSTDDEATAAAAAVTAARLGHLWAQQGGAAATRVAEGDSNSNGSAEGGLKVSHAGGLLLHVCAGPGAILAVREALSAGAGEEATEQHGRQGHGGAVALPIPRGREEREGEGLVPGVDNNGRNSQADGGESSSGIGIGCKIGGCTVAALGSLREHGAYCVAELAMPRRGGDAATTSSSSWSVADVQFGKVDGCDGERKESKRRLAHAAAGNFVLNYG